MKINWKALAWAAVIGLVLYFVIASPERSADTVGNALASLRNGADRVITFVTAVFA